jgi:hypothetical protein
MHMCSFCLICNKGRGCLAILFFSHSFVYADGLYFQIYAALVLSNFPFYLCYFERPPPPLPLALLLSSPTLALPPSPPSPLLPLQGKRTRKGFEAGGQKKAKAKKTMKAAPRLSEYQMK